MLCILCEDFTTWKCHDIILSSLLFKICSMFNVSSLLWQIKHFTHYTEWTLYDWCKTKMIFKMILKMQMWFMKTVNIANFVYNRLQDCLRHNLMLTYVWFTDAHDDQYDTCCDNHTMMFILFFRIKLMTKFEIMM